MDFFVSLYKFAATEMAIPTNYDVFHLAWVGVVIAVAVLLVCAFKNISEKNFRKLAAGLWITMVVLEIIKQLVFGFRVVDGALVWNYEWYSFPFQFCSSPLYILPIVAFARDGKIRDAAITFLATFSLFAGICVYVFPNDVFTYFTFINHQTMIHHGVQVFFGIYLAFRYREKMKFKDLVWATVIFSALAATALGMNIGMYHIFQNLGMNDIFNMFFISPYYDCTLPLLSMVYSAVPYPVFLCVYIFGFMLCAGLVMLIMKGVVKGSDVIRKLVLRK